MRLGAPIFTDYDSAEAFAKAHKKKGYRAAYCPGGLKAGQTELIQQYRDAMQQHDIVIAEVGAWCNPLSTNPEESKKNIEFLIERLTLADELNATVCVNILGSGHDTIWCGPSAKGYSQDFFDYAIEVYRKIIDAVKPTRTKMSFEIMPFAFLDSAEEYLGFLGALDRPDAAGIHFDPANCIHSPRVFYNNAAYLAETIRLLGDAILSIHLKDIALREDAVTVMFDEVLIGTGGLDYVSLLEELGNLPADTPAMLEHLPDEASYDTAAANVRAFAKKAGVSF